MASRVCAELLGATWVCCKRGGKKRWSGSFLQRMARNTRRYSSETCVELLATLGGLRRHQSYWMGCVASNTEATIQRASLSLRKDVWRRANVRDALRRLKN